MHIATVSGIPVRLHPTFLMLAVAYGAYALSAGGLAGLLETAIVMAVLFGSVVLHELGHAAAARGYGIRTAHITLYPFGGIAAVEDMPRTPRHEAVIAAAGPAVNVVLALFFGALWMVFGGSALVLFAGINVIMGVFNLIPAFPMDGGRILRALLTPTFGWVLASRIAIGVGRVFAVVFLVAGLAWGQLGLGLVGAFLLFATWSEARNVRRISRMLKARAAAAQRWFDAPPVAPYRPRWRLDP